MAYVTGAPAFSAADFAVGLMRLLPTGRAWPRDPDSVLSQIIAAQAPSYARQHARANALLIDAFPATAVELLPEWEATLGLPDPCAGPDATIEQRQRHVVARLTETDGPSIPSLTAFAAALGDAIAIKEFAPRRFGGPLTQPFGGADWAHAWQVQAPGFAVQVRRFGLWRFGDPFAEVTRNAVLECELARLKPAHTALSFAFV